MIGDKHSVLNLARRRLSLPPPVFRFTPFAPDKVPGSRLMLGFAKQSEFTSPKTEASLSGFQRSPAACFEGGPVSVLEVIKFFTQVQGGIHVGAPKLPFEILAHSFVGHMGIDVGRMWMRALVAIAQVTVLAAQPLVDAITTNRPELAEGTWPARTE
ncbi:hypothetical protein [Microbacterium foliorum]|uniref:hypothetical protein n=1 Tax=Microbacterium foliorum TaxID=104336 RepID=UPI001D3BFBEF|nr:hypothetical protein [Microbacterium foliorum]CAH0138464.1 hypothetical protein SRABI03_00453 [Microbacterium foliorum]CAH0208580.1 hypothetical protein SRABI44_02111 [Microbacterium foliorum]